MGFFAEGKFRGGGVRGIPQYIQIVRPNSHITMLRSTGKRVPCGGHDSLGEDCLSLTTAAPSKDLSKKGERKNNRADQEGVEHWGGQKKGIQKNIVSLCETRKEGAPQQDVRCNRNTDLKES